MYYNIKPKTVPSWRYLTFCPSISLRVQTLHTGVVDYGATRSTAPPGPPGPDGEEEEEEEAGEGDEVGLPYDNRRGFYFDEATSGDTGSYRCVFARNGTNENGSHVRTEEEYKIMVLVMRKLGELMPEEEELVYGNWFWKELMLLTATGWGKSCVFILALLTPHFFHKQTKLLAFSRHSVN